MTKLPPAKYAETCKHDRQHGASLMRECLLQVAQADIGRQVAHYVEQGVADHVASVTKSEGRR